jgi:hypothetical protein
MGLAVKLDDAAEFGIVFLSSPKLFRSPKPQQTLC